MNTSPTITDLATDLKKRYAASKERYTYHAVRSASLMNSGRETAALFEWDKAEDELDQMENINSLYYDLTGANIHD